MAEPTPPLTPNEWTAARLAILSGLWTEHGTCRHCGCKEARDDQSWPHEPWCNAGVALAALDRFKAPPSGPAVRAHVQALQAVVEMGPGELLLPQARLWRDLAAIHTHWPEEVREGLRQAAAEVERRAVLLGAIPLPERPARRKRKKRPRGEAVQPKPIRRYCPACDDLVHVGTAAAPPPADTLPPCPRCGGQTMNSRQMKEGDRAE